MGSIETCRKTTDALKGRSGKVSTSWIQILAKNRSKWKIWKEAYWLGTNAVEIGLDNYS